LSTSSEHPPHQELVDFGLGILGPDQTSQIEQHLDDCNECHDTLLNLADDTFTELVRSLPEPVETPLPNASHGASPDEERTDAAEPNSESSHAATMIVPSGQSLERSDLPADLMDHPRYRIVDQIGKGGMGDVYRAEHRLMNRSVALKLINSQLVKHPQGVKRFQREVQAAARLTHPNIVTAFDAEQAGAVHFLAMEFVEGTDLATIVLDRGPMPVGEACECIRQVADGLQHAHEQGMVHRDIKPHNLMLSPDGQVRILDFGLASFATESALIDDDAAGDSNADTAARHLTALGSVMGTPDYIAPEQARDAHSADIRADIYSLGCTLYYLLSGEPPHKADSIVEKLQAHAEHAPEAIESLRTDVPEHLADVIRRMMSKDPEERFQTPAEVAAALEPFVAKHSTSVQSVPPQSGIRRLLSSPAGWFSAVLLAGVILVMTTQGNFEVRSDIDGVQVTISKGSETFRVFDVNSGTSIFWLPSAEFQVRARGDVDVAVSQKDVQITWMGKQIIKIEQVPQSSEAFGPQKMSGEQIAASAEREDDVASHPSADATEESSSTADRLQGKWVPVSGHLGITPISAEQLERMSITLQDNRAELTGPENTQTQPGTFAINVEHAPHHIDLIAPDGKERFPGIFEFDDDRLRLAFIDEDYARPTDFSASDRPGHITAVFVRAADAQAAKQKTDRLPLELQSARAFLAELDKDRFDSAYDFLAAPLRQKTTRNQFSQAMQKLRDTYGTAARRSLHRIQAFDSSAEQPDGTYAGIQYKSEFKNQKEVWESILLTLDSDDNWRVRRYTNTLEPESFSDLNNDQKRKKLSKPPSTTGPNSPPRRTGILTNPPAVPSGGVPVGKNLIADPSLEDTRTGSLPQSWSAWLDDGPNFKCEVVEGGVTGRHCLQISGEGTRGVVFCTSIPMDRTKRYALRGRVRVEGEAGTWAVIKLNYFNKSGWLGVDDRAGVTSNDFDWKLLKKTDMADRYPTATLMVPTCHIEGNGTAWFDDLEVIAYDGDKLPTNFDATHGKNNRMK
jgi:uncharacterized protein (TIGR03067 family)